MVPEQSRKMFGMFLVTHFLHLVSQTPINAAVDQSADDEIKARIKSKIEYIIIYLAIPIFQAENRKSEAYTRSPTSTCEWARRRHRTGIGYHWHPYARKRKVGRKSSGFGRVGAGVGNAEGKGCEDAFVDEGRDGEVWGVVEMG
ncbi:hypothetical protein BGAL_0093g00270 [Botrytis galanthina]|uniref:Uncharacterized protein n=1 Tax=Botrytis galanthina TaxID=278940 RepID=A0A4S8R2E2_9HELO|nr:hypothetical protein BGAL_0093g00270 [Botrytis galanthina]